MCTASRRGRLASAGGGGYAVTGLHDVVPTKFSQANYQIQAANDYGNDYSYWSGVT